MKTWIALLGILFLGSTSVVASQNHYPTHYGNYYNGQSYIFVEQGIEFSIFPDGQFDFVYVGGNTGTNVSFNWYTPGVNVSFNSGYNYDMYVQYDDYGAVVQVESVPIYYDYYGRIVQAGNVEIRYNDRRIVRVGGMRIHYNSFGYYTHFTGYVSPFYTTYIYRPWHVYYAPPIYNSCVVYSYPYRRYYTPVRYDYAYHHRNYNRGRSNYTNGRGEFYRPGSRVHHRDGRVARNSNYRSERAKHDRSVGRTGRNGRNDVAHTRPMVDNERNERPKNTRIDRTSPSSNNNTAVRGVPKDRNNKVRTTNSRPKVDKGRISKTTVKRDRGSSFQNGTQRGTTVKKSTARKNSTVARNNKSNSRKATPNKRSTNKREGKRTTKSRRGL